MSYRYADTRWMRGSFGLSFHWTAQTVRRNGASSPWCDAVADFDPDALADALLSVGAKHCIFTLTHALQYLPMPHPLLDRLLPGRTARRDLVGDLAEALRKRGIRLIAYYNHSCNGRDDPEWAAACGYADGPRHDLPKFGETICGIVRFIAERYGDAISAWWFDSGYSVDRSGPVDAVNCDLGDWRFPWRELNQAAKAGYADCAVTFNAGVGRRHLYSECQDYYAGETTELFRPFEAEPRPELVDTRWAALDSPRWVFTAGLRDKSGFEVAPRFSAAEVAAFCRGNRAADRMTTFNVLIDRDGAVNPAAFALLRRIAAE